MEDKRKEKNKRNKHLNYYYCTVPYQFELDLVFSCVLINADKA